MFGTVWGSVGLLAFGLVIWRMGPSRSVALVLCLAMLAWFAGALSTWELRRLMKRKRAVRHGSNLDQVSMPNSQH